MAELQLNVKPPVVPVIRRRPEHVGNRVGSIFSHGVLLSYSLLALLPLLLILMNSFKDRTSLFRVPYQPPITVAQPATEEVKAHGPEMRRPPK